MIHRLETPTRPEEPPASVGRADQSIHMVDLKQAVEAAKGEVRSIKMEGTTQPITDASANFVAGK